MAPVEYLTMIDPESKTEIRRRLALLTIKEGPSCAAVAFGCDRKTAALWRDRWLAQGHRGLLDRSRAPKTCPHKTSDSEVQRIVEARAQAPCFGPARLKRYYGIIAGYGALTRILRERNLTRRRKKKHEKKKDMRDFKAQFKALTRPQVDVKYLHDIPPYYEQLLASLDLPRFEYTWRDPKTGAVFLGFANQLSESHACLFVERLGRHLQAHAMNLDDTVWQTDNGSEFSGAERRAGRGRGFTHTIENLLGARHRFIPVGKKNYQADVESFHALIEDEFFMLERFASRLDFFRKASLYQRWFNFGRVLTTKNNQTPAQILVADASAPGPACLAIPVLDLDAMLARRAMARPCPTQPKSGEDVPALPEIQAR